MKNKIIHGNTPETLKDFSSESIDCIITSPPYWGLRDYGEQTKVIWGNDKKCKHSWKKSTRYLHRGSTRLKGWSDETGHFNEKKTVDSFCRRCGAWYGQLGLEPTLGLFFEHLLQITAELKRVLKPTGVMFWNHGDCYGGSGGSGGDYNKGGLREGQPRVGKIGLGTQPKCLALQNYRLIFKMIDEQDWILRNIIIWQKPNHMPSSAKDRFATSYEPVFMLVKNEKYYFDLDAVRIPQQGQAHSRGKHPTILKGTNSLTAGKAKKEGGWNELPARNNPVGKNPGDVWGVKSLEQRMNDTKDKNQQQSPAYNVKKLLSETRLGIKPTFFYQGTKNDIWKIPAQPFPEAHFATFPERLIEPMIKAGCPKNGIVLDPFMGSGTVAKVARAMGRKYLGIELNHEYIKIAERRLAQEVLF